MSSDTRVAFYYGSRWPLDGARAFNIVVVDPKNKPANQYNSDSSQLYAYVSIGETDATAVYKSKINKDWVIGANPDWNSDIMDLSNPTWRSFLLSELIDPLWENGYRGFFFDTLDSYLLTKKAPTAQQDGLVALINAVKQKYPDAKIILNRGFEIIPKVHANIEAVVAESLFSAWVPKSKSYRPVSEQSRQWLLNALQKIKTEFQLPVIVIDYLPDNQKQQARELAKKIEQLGFIPWVTNGSLSTLGVGLVEVMPRKVLILLDPINKEEGSDESTFQPLVFPLQYMGYIPVLWRIGETFPEDLNSDEYAGILAWFNHPVVKNHKQLNAFLLKQSINGIPIVLFNYLGLPSNASFLSHFGIKSGQVKVVPQNVSTTINSNLLGYEIKVQSNVISFFPLSIARGQPLVKVVSDAKEVQIAGAITSFGGFILDPFVIADLPGAQMRWVVDPFQFLKQSLHLPDMPIPDMTTANGRRMLMIHVDGDGYISSIPWLIEKYAGDLMLEQIFKKYQLPITVSVIQREFEIVKESNQDAYSHLVTVAKDTYALPWVHIATHTYSHPLQWAKLVEGEENKKYLSYPTPSYRFNYEKEINGSVQFIEKHLAPKNKKVQAIFWSGDALVSKKPLQIADNAHLLNLNGMNVYVPHSNSISNLAGLGRFVDNYFHVYSPLPNDFEYTDNWSRPLYRFANVIETFKETESPHRYKPISIYYHFYSAVDQGAFRALNQVYEWALQQKTTPVYVTDYIKKVIAFNRLVISKTLNGTWLITNNAPLYEFRVPISMGMPVISAKNNIIGFNEANQDYYIHLGTNPDTYLDFTQASKPGSAVPFLVEVNANDISWKELSNGHYTLQLKGNAPLIFKLGNTEHCKISEGNIALALGQDGYYRLKDKWSGEIAIQCN